MTDYNEDIDSQDDDVEVETTEEETTTDDKELSDREKQFLARAKKAEGKLKVAKEAITEPKPDLKKPNTEQELPTMEDMALLSQGHSLEEMEVITKMAKLDGISKMEAAKTDFVISKITSMRDDAKVKANALPPSGGSAPTPREKTIGNMSEDEHRAKWEEASKNAANK